MFISELNKNAQAIDIIQLFAEVLNDNAQFAIDLNTSQLEVSKDSKNEFLDPTLSDPGYATEKLLRGGKAEEGRPDLKNEGDFYWGFMAEADSEANLLMTSSDSKTDKLKGKYGEDIFGLTDKSKADLKSVILPQLIERLKNGLLRKG